MATNVSTDIVILAATPGGISAAIAAAEAGRRVVLLERTAHIGGLPANGLGATDISTRGSTTGLFMRFVDSIRDHYLDAYGRESHQFADCSDGYHFEPHVAEAVFEAMIAEQPNITLHKMRQFDAEAGNVEKDGSRVTAIVVANRETGEAERYEARVFIDATYEGDLAAAAGAEFRIGRESKDEFNEPMAGVLYKPWRDGPDPVHSTGEGDDRIQAYNYRVCLTNDPLRRIPIDKPANYNRDEFASLADDVNLDRKTGSQWREKHYEDIGRIVNMVILPNNKTDANNQHLAFISTDLPEENYPWPTADWDWRDRFAQRLREYTLGLIWFAQHDPELPEAFRRGCLRWGLARDEYEDNGHFPRQVYVREGRRIVGEHLFIAQDSLPTAEGQRPPLYADSITASHYGHDSHAVKKREEGMGHLDGFFNSHTEPYTVPYGVIIPKGVDGLLIPVPVSGTHIGFSTLRMEPCWMALGEAAGAAAAVSIDDNALPRSVDLEAVQDVLLARGVTLIYFRDVDPTHEAFAALQRSALRGAVTDWEARLDEPAARDDAETWAKALGVELPPEFTAGATTRGQLLIMLDAARRRADAD